MRVYRCPYCPFESDDPETGFQHVTSRACRIRPRDGKVPAWLSRLAAIPRWTDVPELAERLRAR